MSYNLLLLFVGGGEDEVCIIGPLPIYLWYFYEVPPDHPTTVMDTVTESSKLGLLLESSTFNGGKMSSPLTPCLANCLNGYQCIDHLPSGS